MKGYIFDLDGTLLDSQWVWKSSTVEIFEELELPNVEELYLEMRSFSLEEANDFIIERFQLPYTRDEMIERVSVKVKEKYDHLVKAKDGVLEKLKAFHEAKIKMVIATASEKEFILGCLDRLGITDLMDHIITTSEYNTNKKDEAVIYDEACKLMHLNKEEVVVFEDALHAIETLKKNGYRVYAIEDDDEIDHRQQIQQLADRYIRDWNEFC
ncbi:MAG: HAD family hydrolase [Beduini sp.]|uniref:HAD family hydrolase n=2 Tax=Beduini sp. TaxID=1922300 RepID=UPI0011C7D147